MIEERRKRLVLSPSAKVTSDDLSEFDIPIWEVSARKKSPQYAVMIAVASDIASKSKSGSPTNGLFLAVTTRNKTRTSRTIKA